MFGFHSRMRPQTHVTKACVRHWSVLALPFSDSHKRPKGHDVRAREDSLLGVGAEDRRVLADLVAAPGGGRATTYVHEEIP